MEDEALLRQAIWQEFSSQYLADELPPEWSQDFLENELVDRAKRSARRLEDRVKGKAAIHDLARILLEAAENAQHPVIQVISDATLIDWAEEESDWVVLQRLLTMIAAHLQHQG